MREGPYQEFEGAIEGLAEALEASVPRVSERQPQHHRDESHDRQDQLKKIAQLMSGSLAEQGSPSLEGEIDLDEIPAGEVVFGESGFLEMYGYELDLPDVRVGNTPELIGYQDILDAAAELGIDLLNEN